MKILIFGFFSLKSAPMFMPFRPGKDSRKGLNGKQIFIERHSD